MESLLTIEEAAQVLGVSKAQIRQWTHEESIPNLKLGGLVRFRRKEIEIWLSKKREKGSRKRTEDADILITSCQQGVGTRTQWKKDYRKIKDCLATLKSDLKKGERNQS